MTRYHFSGRVASFFRATGNSWASLRTISETLGGKTNVLHNELSKLHEFEHLERRGERRSYEYRWDPDTLFKEAQTR